jgi:leucyl-tRNA synthetase
MSSSKGHVVLPSDAIEAYGADTVRFYLLNSAEPWGDYDWRDDQVASTRESLDRFWTRAVDVIDAAGGPVGDGGAADRSPLDLSGGGGDADGEGAPAADAGLKRIDRWLLSKLQSTVREVTDAMEGYETRTASQAAFHGFEAPLRWYRRRTEGEDRPGIDATRRRVLETRLRLLAPFVPFLANELHERLTGVPADDAAWPEPAPAFERRSVEVEEGLVRDLTDDVADVLDVTGVDPETIRIYVAAPWKRRVFDAVREAGGGNADRGDVMGRVMQYESLRERGDAVNDLAGDLIAFARDHDDGTLSHLAETDETDVYDGAAGFLAREFDATVEVHRGDDDPPDPGEKAGDAVPFRPAIYVE